MSGQGESDRDVSGARESPVRSLMAQAGGLPYVALPTLAEAQATPAGVVILEGDTGGQIYLTVPARLVRIDEAGLERLLRALDTLEWNDPEEAGVYFELWPEGAAVAGGMGGALVTEGVWLHPRLEAARGLRRAVEHALAGEPYELPDQLAG